MACVRREILATLPPVSLFIKFTNFISRACADYYADEVYKSTCDMQTPSFILPPSRRLNFIYSRATTCASKSACIYASAKYRAALNLKDKFHSCRFKILKFQSPICLNLTEVGKV